MKYPDRRGGVTPQYVVSFAVPRLSLCPWCMSLAFYLISRLTPWHSSELLMSGTEFTLIIKASKYSINNCNITIIGKIHNGIKLLLNTFDLLK